MVLHRCHLPLACPLALDHLLAVKVTTEDQLAALQSVTCLMGPFYQQLKTCQDWLLDNGDGDGMGVGVGVGVGVGERCARALRSAARCSSGQHNHSAVGWGGAPYSLRQLAK